MVYLAQLLVVMTDRLKIDRICAWNVNRVHGVHLSRLSCSRKATVLCLRCTGAPSCSNTKKLSWDNLCMFGSGL